VAKYDAEKSHKMDVSAKYCIFELLLIGLTTLDFMYKLKSLGTFGIL